MEIVTEEPLKILSQILIPLILVATSCIIPAFISHFSKRQDKNEYIRFLRTNNSTIKSYLDSIETYNTIKQLNPFVFVLGITIGVIFGAIINPSLVSIFTHVFEIDYIETKFPIIHDHTLNSVLFLFSYLHISILIIFVIWGGWYRFLRSKKFVAPKLTEYKLIKLSSMLVYWSFWVFLGAVIGIVIVLYLITVASFTRFSIITDDFAFNWITLVGVYESLKNNVSYFNFYMVVYCMGLFTTLLYSLDVNYSITTFSREVNGLIANSYRSDFPEVKIITEYGEVKGKLEDILNKHQVTLNENSTVKTMMWDKIEMMEITRTEK